MASGKRISLLYLHSSDEMYGADLILLQLIDGLEPDSFHPIVVLPIDMPFDCKLSQALNTRGVEVHKINLAVLRRSYMRPLRFLLYLQRFLFSVIWLIHFIKSRQIDIVHSNTLAVIPGSIAAWLTNTPHVWHIHEIIINPKLLWRLTSWLTAHLADVVVAVSQPARNHLCIGNPGNKERCIVIHNGIDLRRFDQAIGSGEAIRKSWGIHPEQVLVGMVGRFSHWKGQNYLLTVAEQVLSQHSIAHFVFVGGTVPGQTTIYENFQRLIADKGLANKITISGYREDVPSILDAFDIFVLPSILPDPFPTVVLEAMAMAKPIVANAHGGCIEMIENEQTGFLTSPNQSDEMALAIGYFIQHPTERIQMGLKSRRRLEELFSLPSFVAAWINVYKQLSKNKLS